MRERELSEVRIGGKLMKLKHLEAVVFLLVGLLAIAVLSRSHDRLEAYYYDNPARGGAGYRR
jgi:hypothetical protein